ncbi:MAG: hypothetical protein ACLUL2_18065 [Blautia sp.]
MAPAVCVWLEIRNTAEESKMDTSLYHARYAEGDVIETMSEKVVDARKTILNLLLSNHKTDCFSCAQNGRCKLQDYCVEYGRG